MLIKQMLLDGLEREHDEEIIVAAVAARAALLMAGAKKRSKHGSSVAASVRGREEEHANPMKAMDESEELPSASN